MWNVPVCHLVLHKHYKMLVPTPDSLLPLNAKRYVRYYNHSEIWISWLLLVCPYNLNIPVMQFLDGSNSTSSAQSPSLNKITLQVFFSNYIIYLKLSHELIFYQFTRFWKAFYYCKLTMKLSDLFPFPFLLRKKKKGEWVLMPRNICL